MKYILKFIQIILIVTVVHHYALYADFIYDDEKPSKEDSQQAGEKPEVIADKKISKYVARNIKAEIIQNLQNSIRISWDMAQDADDDFYVGRSSVICDSPDIALKSVSIKVVPSGTKPEAIDSDLKPGSYYYCILSKNSIIGKKIELVAGQNFTTIPVVVGPTPVRKELPSLSKQVTLIYARMMKNGIRITWKGIDEDGIAYTVYRGQTPLDSPEKIQGAVKIYTISDGRESYIDNSINKDGAYFYAVTVTDRNGKEDLNLVPNQSYTISGIYYIMETAVPVKNISVMTDEKGVRISWDITGGNVLEYLIYRSNNIISDTKNISQAEFAGRVPGNETSYMDYSINQGSYYYAVLTKSVDGKVLNDLVKGENYSTEPAVIGYPIKLISLSGYTNRNDIILSWDVTGNLGSKNYKLFRNKTPVKKIDDLKSANLVDNIDISDLEYIDRNLDPGIYYYALVPDSFGNDYLLKPGENLITRGIMIQDSRAEITAEPVIEKKPATDTGSLEPRISYYEESIPAVTDVDKILQIYFLPGKYKHTISKLKKFIKSSGNRNDAAKANLYIGRSYIELKEYKTALDYLILRDVNEIFPEEAAFWRDYAVSRIFNGNYIINENLNNKYP